MLVLLMIFARIFFHMTVENEIKDSLTREIRRNARFIQADINSWEIKDGFEGKSGEILWLIIDEKGQNLYGEYPNGFPENISEEKELHKVRSFTRRVIYNGEEYYVRDHVLTRIEEDRIALRGILKTADVYSDYQMLERLTYIGIFAIYTIGIIGVIFQSKRIAKDMKCICREAEDIGTSLDMSKRMEYEGKFYEIDVLTKANNRMLDQIERSFRLQEQFNSDVSHELRTPVAVIMAQCQSVMDKEITREEIDTILDVVYHQALKIHTIVTQLLRLSRLEQDRIQIHKENVDVIELVESVCEEMQEKRTEEVEFELHLQEVHTIGDINLIMIVLENLIGNAIKFSPQNEKIEITTGEREDYVFVSVKDYGIGISKEEQEDIFKRFYKSDKSRNREGFGLGLALSQKIAEKHGGTIEVESQEGKGSKFTLLLNKL